MSITRTMAILQGPSGLPEDQFVNTWHFITPDGADREDVAAAINDGLTDFYTEMLPHTPVGVDWKETRSYDLADPEPREPVTLSLDPVGTRADVLDLPREVAVCLSFYAERNLPRQRGRLYLGPLNSEVVQEDGDGNPRVAAALVASVQAAVTALQNSLGAATPSGIVWAMYSRTVMLARPVTNAWVDNAFDTQRRRGFAPSSRTTISVQVADLRTPVGEFFRLGEFADRRGGGLPPVESHVHIARLCCLLLDPLRRRFGVTRVSSGWRTDASNATVGGAKASLHMYHRTPTTPAADVQCAKGTPADWYEFLDSIIPHTGGLGRYNGHVHVDRRRTRARWTG